MVDYFLILSAIIGVGFASGKEIYFYFFRFGQMSFLGLIFFALLYLYLFLIVQHISLKLKIESYSEFNAKIFGKFCKITNIVMLINFVFTSAGMLAGANYLFQIAFGFDGQYISLFLSLLTKSFSGISSIFEISVAINNKTFSISPLKRGRTWCILK